MFVIVGTRAAAVASGKHTILMTIRGRCLPSNNVDEKQETGTESTAEETSSASKRAQKLEETETGSVKAGSSTAKRARKVEVNDKVLVTEPGLGPAKRARKIEGSKTELGSKVESSNTKHRVSRVEKSKTDVAAKEGLCGKKQRNSNVQCDLKGRTFNELSFTVTSKPKVKAEPKVMVAKDELIDLCDDDEPVVEAKLTEVTVIDNTCSDSDDDFVVFKPRILKRKIGDSNSKTKSSKTCVISEEI